MTKKNNVVPLTPPAASDWQEALQALEPDIYDLERAAEIADLMMERDNTQHLTAFAVAQMLRLSQELKEKYYKLHPYKGD